eukprot:TRINITY_DN2125_c0_g1_i2.p1 TRINITY_DN2125_c0_g1~~TRINITY_DN2125_c0_g1_i2.p1  ORF type:complete len:397 (-),score=54.46 TRINITY_DN2125_c0_g1_i2:19-1209(-)
MSSPKSPTPKSTPKQKHEKLGTREKQDRVQKKTFTRWVNTHLADRKLVVKDLQEDLWDGIFLINLVEIISSKSIGGHNKNPKLKLHRTENIGKALKFIVDQGIKLVNIGADDIEAKNLTIILGLIWTLILRYQINKAAGSGDSPGLQDWVTGNMAYYGVHVTGFRSGWNDGRAISALTDSLSPGVIDFKNLGPPLEATEKAITIAEKLGVPRMMDAEDMVDNPDEHSLMTYASYFQKSYIERQAAGLIPERPKSPEQITHVEVPASPPTIEAKVEVSPELCFIEGDFSDEFSNGSKQANFVCVLSNGEKATSGGAPVTATLVGVGSPSGATPFTVKVVDAGNGYYSLVFPADSDKEKELPPGDYELHVKVNDKNAKEIGRAVQQECRDRSRMPSSA